MPRTLLLADDSVTIQRVIELTFADEDVRVVAVGDGQQAIDRIERERPDVVLADVGMPERDGYEVAAFVKGNPALAHIPVVLLTGAFEPIDEARAKAVGCDGVLVKPFEPQMVINRVKDLLAGNRPSTPWGAEPAAERPLDATQSGAAIRSVPPAGSEALEDYFDRLDAAFATVGSPPSADTLTLSEPPAITPASANALAAGRQDAPAQAAAPGNLASSDPGHVGDPARSGPVVQPSSGVESWFPEKLAVAPLPVAPEPVPLAAPPPSILAATQPPPLFEAFAALLAAEQGVALSPSTASLVTDDALVDAIANRVLARLGDSSLRPAVLDAAERLVREELDHLKTGR